MSLTTVYYQFFVCCRGWRGIVGCCVLFTGSGSLYNVTLWPASNSCGTYLLRGTAAMSPPPSKEGRQVDGDLQALQITINSHSANSTNTTGRLIAVSPYQTLPMSHLFVQRQFVVGAAPLPAAPPQKESSRPSSLRANPDFACLLLGISQAQRCLLFELVLSVVMLPYMNASQTSGCLHG